MVFHFTLKGIFLFSVGLILWQVLLPYTLLAAALALGGYALWRRKDFSAADGIFAAALLMNVWYIADSWGNVRQYDYYNFVMQADYYIRNDLFIGKPELFLQEVYFQPPLWGLITALITKCCMFLGATQEQGFDCVRYISLFCVSGVGILFWRMMVLFKFAPKVQLGIFALFCFFPANSLLANLVNNDAAVYFLMVAAAYMGCRWYVSGSWKEALSLSGLVFAAGMVKFSGLMIVPAIGVLGLCRLLQAKDKLSPRLWGQFAVIGAGALFGFGWGWFLLYYGLPLVPPPINADYQAMGGFSLAERLFSLRTIGLPFADLGKGQIEANVFMALVKTSLFGEWSWATGVWAELLYGLTIVLVVAAVVCFFSLWRYKLGGEGAFNLFVAVAVFSVLAAWVQFWLSYPYFCSCAFRYVVILLPLSLLWLGNYLSQKSLPQAVNHALAGGVGIFVLAKVMLYLHTI